MPRLSAWALRAALVYLFLGFSIGAAMLANKGVFLSGAIWGLLPMHIEFLLFGWLAQFVFGVGFWIFPRFTVAPRYGRSELAWASVILLNGGILLVVAGVFGLWPAATLAGRAAEALAAALFVGYAWGRIRPTTTGVTKAPEGK